MPRKYFERQRPIHLEGLTECDHGVRKHAHSAIASNCRRCISLRDRAMYAADQVYGSTERWREVLPIVRTVRIDRRPLSEIEIEARALRYELETVSAGDLRRSEIERLVVERIAPAAWRHALAAVEAE